MSGLLVIAVAAAILIGGLIGFCLGVHVATFSKANPHDDKGGWRWVP